VHHFARDEAPAQLASHANARTHGEGFLVRRVKVKKAQHAAVAAVVHFHAQLPARLESDFTMRHLGFNLHHIAVTRISKPGRRMYRSVDELKPVLSGFGMAILTTSEGILTDTEARKRKIGGELLCTIS
jgi:hypothetical protein